jgi:hypothetical protein
MPARKRRISTVFWGISKASANSANVNPSITLVSNKKKKKSSKNYYIFLDKCSNNNYNKVNNGKTEVRPWT